AEFKLTHYSKLGPNLDVTSRSAADLGKPPSQADEEEAPVVEELRRLAFEGVTDELENPAGYKHQRRDHSENRKQQANHKQHNGGRNQRNTDRMADTIHAMLVAPAVLADPIPRCFASADPRQ